MFSFRSEQVMHTQHQRLSRHPARPLHLEVLEARCLLSTYTLTDVGMLAEGTDTWGTAINNLGQVVGHSSPLQRAFLWDSGKLTELDTLGGDSNAASGINDSGQVVGWSTLAPGDPYTRHPFLWDSTQGTQDLGTLGGIFSGASAINNAGQVVGGAGNGHAFLWQDGTLTDLFPGDRRFSAATAINHGGDVAGAFNDPIGDQHAAIWYDGVPVPQDLGTLTGRETSIATGINDADLVVGWALSPDRAFLWGNGTMVDLGTLEPDGFGLSGANAINNAGQVVGWSTIPGSATHAFVRSNGVMADLNDLVPEGSGLTLKEATAINDAGQIVVNAWDADRIRHAVLLTPDAGGAPRAVDPGVFRVPAPVHEAAGIGGGTRQTPANALRERAPAETMTPLPVGAAVQQAKDALFASSHQGHTPSPEGGWEIEGLGLGLVLVPPV
jgi:probable HAF family extracellular repeat protein